MFIITPKTIGNCEHLFLCHDGILQKLPSLYTTFIQQQIHMHIILPLDDAHGVAQARVNYLKYA